MRRPTPASALPGVTTTFLILLLVAATLVLVSGRDISHQLTLAACTDSGDCGAFPDSPPVCEYNGRDRVVARESFTFAQQRPAEDARLIQFGDDSAEVMVSSGEDTSQIYSFRRWEDAQRWIFDHSPELGQVTNAAAGPSAQPVRDGYLQMLQLIGLDHEIRIDPVASARLIDEPSGPGTRGMLRRDPQGQVVGVTVVMPVENATSQLQDFAAELGLWDFLSYTVELDAEFEPHRLTVEGPAAEDWSLAQLRAPSSPAATDQSDDLPEYAEDGQSVLRSFVLDLTKEANAALYRDIFAMENIAGSAVPLLTAEEWISAGERAERYDQVVDQITRNAVAVETRHSLPDSQPSEERLTRSVEGLVVPSTSVSGPDSRLLNAHSADLAITSSSFEPVLTCDRSQGQPDRGQR